MYLGVLWGGLGYSRGPGVLLKVLKVLLGGLQMSPGGLRVLLGVSKCPWVALGGRGDALGVPGEFWGSLGSCGGPLGLPGDAPRPQTEHPYKSKKAVWHKLLSKQRRRAVVACFRMTPLYNLPRWGPGDWGQLGAARRQLGASWGQQETFKNLIGATGNIPEPYRGNWGASRNH